MPDQSFTISCTISLSDAAQTLLARETRGHRLLREHDGTGSDIILGQPEPRQILVAPQLRWVQLTSAGYTRYDTDDVRMALRERGIALTNSSQVYAAPCAQHVLALMLADVRQLFPSYESQRSLHDWPHEARRDASYLLNGEAVLLLGLGAIARYLVRLLQPFEMRLFAVRRSGREYEGVEVVREEALEDVLPRADHVVNTLPETPSTRGFVNAARFGRMRRGAKFYNVGRGATVQQDALLAALHSGWLGAAYLDVTDPEPLPPAHPLWTSPRCFITPHSAGGHRGEDERLVQHFVRNLRAFEAGEPLTDRVGES